MAQLRYAKAVACGTALTAAGLAGIYLYSRNCAKKAQMKEELKEETPTFGKGTKAIEERLSQEAEMQQKSQDSGEGDSSKCGGTEGKGCVGGCSHDIESVEKALENLSCTEQLNEPSSDHDTVNEQAPIEESISNIVDEFMTECSMDVSVSTGSSNVSTEQIVEELQVVEESIPSPVEEMVTSAKQQNYESSAPVVDNMQSKPVGTPLTNGNVELDNRSSKKSSQTNGNTSNRNKKSKDTSQTNGNVTVTKKGGKKGDDLPKIQSVDWASSVLLEEKGHSTVTSPNDSNSMTGCEVSSEANSDGSSIDSGHGSRDSGASASPAMPQVPPPQEGPVMYQFEFPSKLCGRLIGKSGKNIRELKDKTGAKVVLKNVPYSNTYQICVVEGLRGEVDGALAYIKKKFPTVDLSRRANTQKQKKGGPPEMTQLHLPEDMTNEILISSVVSGGHIFIQQPSHPTFSTLAIQDNAMTQIYHEADMTPQLPRPIETGVICSAPILDGWYRAQVIDVCHETDEVDIRFLDYGGYARIEGFALRQIRSDFLALPFQATECYMSNIAPLPGELDFNEASRIYIEQLAQSVGVVQANITGYTVDGMPVVEIFFMDSYGKTQSLNKQLVNQGLVSWFEGTEALVQEPMPLSTNGALYSPETTVVPS